MDRLGNALLDKGLITPAQLAEAEERARSRYASLASVLMDEACVAEADILAILAEQYGMPLVDLAEEIPDPRAVKFVSAKLAAHYGVLPLRLDGNVLTLAVSNPLETAAVEDIESARGCRVERVLACRKDIAEAVRRAYGTGAETVERILDETPDAPHAELDSGIGNSQDLEKQAEDASVVRLVNQLLQEAIADRATDIHLEVRRSGVAARRRIDGVLHDTRLPRNIRLLYPAMVSRIKLMSGLNIVERRLPQDGRARVRVGELGYDLRISIVPAVHGEDIVIRILPENMLFGLEQLGLSVVHRSQLEALIARPHGVLVVTGPTGSGKSTTLYACLSQLNSRDRKIITIEDPVEYELDGITQTQIHPQIGLTFARALRSMLRHDPDVMMVGEIRDRETAEIAIQTAMTGHFVLTTLHTNDAAGGAVRLIDMGVDPYLITSTVQAFMAQRLVRTLCPQCKEGVEQDGRMRFRSRGCRSCRQTGYSGRIAICELLEMLEPLQELVLQKASAAQLRRRANELGMATLAQDGRQKVEEGITTAEEVLRVTRM